ncbi:MAG: alpha/beta fold hydrolase [Woeseiaceae bacterium]
MKSNADISIAYQIHGNKENPVILIIQGLGMPLTATPPEIINELVARGYCLLLVDNRDIGHSQIIDEKIPNLLVQVIKYMLGFKVKCFYKLDDMMNDINNLLDEINVNNFHIIGVSMGGMISQLMAIKNPDKVNSLISIMSTTGNPKLPKPKWNIIKYILNGSNKRNINNLESFYIKLWKLIGSRKYPRSNNEIKEFVNRIISRGVSAQGSIRQILAILNSYDRTSGLNEITIPTLVIHGNDDPLVPVECGIDTANAINSSDLWVIEGMGHDFPYELLDQFVDRIDNHIKNVESKS